MKSVQELITTHEETPPANDDLKIRHPAIWLFILIFALGLCFALYTQHLWEDFYITYRSSKNLATGNGLVFTPGEKVHTFTSPLNVLVPAALSYLVGPNSDQTAIWLFRIISCSLLAAAGVFLFQIARTLRFDRIALAVLLGAFAFEPKILDYSINGQEVGFMMFFLALMLRALFVPASKQVLLLGLSCAGLMWTRPDGFIYGGVLCASFWIFKAGSQSRRELLGVFSKAALLGFLLYLPWLMFASTYYGSPIPNTVTAKGLAYQFSFVASIQRTADFLLETFSGSNSHLQRILEPPQAFFGGWFPWLLSYFKIFTWLSSISWLFPFFRKETRAISLAVFLGCAYFYIGMPVVSEWYLPNVSVMTVFAVGAITSDILDSIAVFAGSQRPTRRLLKVRSWVVCLAASLPCLLFASLVASAYSLRIQQREIENGNRMKVGQFLRRNASPRDTVFLEPLGYIGFFSQLKTYDFPGLSSREMVSARRKLGTAMSLDMFGILINELKPTWLVLRPTEIAYVTRTDPSILQTKYRVASVFDVSNNIKKYDWLPGRNYVQFDQVFVVFRSTAPDS